jgi:hypothetical protein
MYCMMLIFVVLHTGDQRQYKRSVVHCAGCGKADVAFRERREHYPDRLDEWKHHEQGAFLLHRVATWRVPVEARLTGRNRILGSRVAVLQHEQIGSIADGTEHGVRTGSEGHTGQYTVSRAHLHFVSVLLFSGVSIISECSDTTAQL